MYEKCKLKVHSMISAPIFPLTRSSLCSFDCFYFDFYENISQDITWLKQFDLVYHSLVRYDKKDYFQNPESGYLTSANQWYYLVFM